jgi:hypothetical protein
MASRYVEPKSHGESSRQSPPTSTHEYKGVSRRHPRDRAPTDRDMDHIKETIQHKTPGSSRWVFEKTICNSRNYKRHERIIHLLTLIDQNGNIQEVGMPKWNGSCNRANDFEIANDREDKR